MYSFKTFLLLCTTAFMFQGQLSPVDSQSVTKQIILSENPYYSVEYTVLSDNVTIRFDLIAATLGYVGFGISPSGTMDGADIIIAGVFSNRTTYSSDRHGTGHEVPTLDSQESWTFGNFSQNETHTGFQVERPIVSLDTSGDVNIPNRTITIIWATQNEQNDGLMHHGPSKGSYRVNLLGGPEDSSSANLILAPHSALCAAVGVLVRFSLGRIMI